MIPLYATWCLILLDGKNIPSMAVIGIKIVVPFDFFLLILHHVLVVFQQFRNRFLATLLKPSVFLKQPENMDSSEKGCMTIGASSIVAAHPEEMRVKRTKTRKNNIR